MVNYRYCDSHAWFGDIRRDWAPGIRPLQMAASLDIRNMPVVIEDRDKDSSMARYENDVRRGPDDGSVWLFTDGSKTDGACGVAFCAPAGGALLVEGGLAVPDTWSIVKAEMFAVLSGMDAVVGHGYGKVHVFLDCKPVLAIIRRMRNSGETSALWDRMGATFNKFDEVVLQWIPGHRGCNLLLSIARFPEGDPAILERRSVNGNLYKRYNKDEGLIE